MWGLLLKGLRKFLKLDKMKTQRVLVVRCDKFKPLIGTWVNITEQDWDENDREIYRTNQTFKRLTDQGEVQNSPLWLHREDFQREPEVVAKDTILSHFDETGKLLPSVTYKGVKNFTYKLEKYINLPDRTGEVEISYAWGNNVMHFRLTVELTFDDNLKPVAKFKKMRYLGVSYYEPIARKEYYVQ